MVRIFLYAVLFFQTVFSENYNDRLRIYIDNSLKNFKVYESGDFSNNIDLNKLLLEYEAKQIYQWLPNARPTDRDGETYLNRYFIVLFESQSEYLAVIANKLRKLSCVDHVELMTINRPTYTPNDPYWNNQYGLELIQADLAFDLWDIDGGEIPGQMASGEIVVGIVDNGLEWDHPDLVGNMWQNLGEDADGDGVVIIQSGGNWIFDPGDINGIDDDGDNYVDNFVGWDVSFNDNDPMPPNNQYDHGTSVAGCVSASTNNGTGIASVGWSVKLMGINSTDDPGFVTDGYSGILAAGQMGADVINLSWGGFGGGNQSVINSVYNNYGCIVVASAGNGDDNGNTNFDFHSPSGLNNVISVSAIGAGDNFNCWATAGTTVDLCAPGENIRTTDLNGGYGSFLGTSFSSPITAGAIALLWSRFPSADQEWITDRILSNTDQFSDMTASCNAGSLEGMLGTGRLNINKALTAGIFPSLYIADVNYLNDSDDDGVFNPGETVKVKVIVGNEEGWADGENVIATLSSADDRILILDDTIEFSNNIPTGGTAFTLIDHFLVQALENAQLGDVPCMIHLQAGAEPPYYETNIDVSISISLDQYGFDFPTSGMVLKSSPIIADLYGNSMGQVFVGGDNGNMYGYMVGGNELTGFPFTAADKIRSSPAVGDVDNDGSNELVFGSHDGGLYILSLVGTQELVYLQNGYIVGSPALADLDGDNDMEIIFSTQRGSTSGELFAIHHDGSDVEGFPVNIDEKMLVGPAIGDLEGDGLIDIVLCTWDDNIYAINNVGAVKSGFPFVSTNRFNAPPTLVDIDGDGDIEILAGNDSGLLHILHHDGSEMASFNTGDDIRGGISVSDLNDDGYYEVLFTGYDDFLHIWDPIAGQELEGWPIDLGTNSLSEPTTADLDNDGDLEVIGANKNGQIFIFHHDGTFFNHFPTNISGNIESSPAIGDIDNDGDFEIAVATTMGLKVMDIKTELGPRISWKMHRGNEYRSGSLAMSLLSNSKQKDLLPKTFYVGPNYPNPFNPSTTIDIQTVFDGEFLVNVYDISGRLINTLMNENLASGFYSIKWNGQNYMGESMPTGIYFIQVESGADLSVQKIMLIK